MTHPFLTFASLLVIVTVLGVVAWNVASKRWDALSWRNLFALGFAYYIGISALGISRGVIVGPAGNIGSGANLMAVTLIVFLVLFYLGAWWGRRRAGLVKLVPRVELPLTGAAVLGTVAMLLSFSLVLALVPIQTYALGAMLMFRGPVAAAAVGLATYYLIVRRFNPLAWAVFGTVLALTVVITVVGTPGRRAVLSVLFIIPWVWYFASWRYRNRLANYARLGVGTAMGVAMILIYTPLRHQGLGVGGHAATFETRSQQLIGIAQDPLKHLDLEYLGEFVYSDAGPNSLFIIESYPASYAHRPLAAAYWMVVNPIPRVLWPEKPEALGIVLQRQMRADANLGPGIIGHGWFEGGMLGVAAYALFFGVFTGVMDRALAQRAWNPFFVVIAGSHLGNVFGLARGDTGLFFLEILLGVLGCAALLTIFNLVFGRVAAALPPLPAPAGVPPEYVEPAAAPGEWDDPGDRDEADEHEPEEAARAWGAQG
ncbi:MAG: hypothetical protein WD749_01370 [Phycisphaerales bacterium]